jgi:hypothetical protein
MLLEALIVTVCVNGYDGCSQAQSAYYEQSPELKQIVRNVDQYKKRVLKDKEWMVYVGTPVYAIASKRPAKILIWRGTTISVDPWTQSFGLQWSY